MSFPLAPPPPDVETSGPLPDVVDAIARAIQAEQRDSYEAAVGSLRFTEGGGLGAGAFPARPFEENGLRTLLVYLNDVFPRATPVFLRMPEDLASTVFHTLLTPALDDDTTPRKIRVRERRWKGVPRVFACTSPSYADGYDVDALARDVCAVFGDAASEVRATARYTAATAALRLALAFPDGAGVVIEASDAGGDEGSVRIRATLDGAELGEPCPAVKRRKRAGRIEGAEGMVEYLATKIAGVPGLVDAARARRRTG